MSYLERNQKLLTLPSGATVKIRKLRTSDFLSVGTLPVVLGQARNGHRAQKPEEVTPEQIKFGASMAIVILTCCCGPVQEGESKLRIVNKPFSEASESELPIELLDQADADCIVNEVMAWSGFGKEAAEAARPFPSGQNTNGHTGSTGATVRSSADSVTSPEPN